MHWLAHNKDRTGGILMLLIGLATVFGALRYKMGGLANIGPGFFPAAVGAMLAFVGFLITITAASNELDERDRLPPEWRGLPRYSI